MGYGFAHYHYRYTTVVIIAPEGMPTGEADNSPNRTYQKTALRSRTNLLACSTV